MGMRLNKYLSAIGLCSRRQADQWIEAGRVRVNGAVASIGMQVGEEDLVEVDGEAVSGKARDVRPVLLMYYKPRGVVCTTSEKDRAPNIIEALSYPLRVYPVGRLDKDSEGLIFLTNQGELVNRINRARFHHEKEYVVTVDKALTREALSGMAEGVYLPELSVRTRPCLVWQEPDGEEGSPLSGTVGACPALPKDVMARQFHIVLTQGLNRQIRRMCAAFGYRVERLVRIRILSVSLGGLKPGEYREMDVSELGLP